jgi:hypothetical protein
VSPECLQAPASPVENHQCISSACCCSHCSIPQFTEGEPVQCQRSESSSDFVRQWCRLRLRTRGGGGGVGVGGGGNLDASLLMKDRIFLDKTLWELNQWCLTAYCQLQRSYGQQDGCSGGIGSLAQFHWPPRHPVLQRLPSISIVSTEARKRPSSIFMTRVISSSQGNGA